MGWVWVKRWYPQDNRGAKWSLLIHCGCGLGQAVIAADACLLRACGRPVQGQQAKTRIFVRNGATIGPRTHSPPAWRIGPATLQIGNSKRAGVGIGPWSAASLPQRRGCNLGAEASSAEVAAAVCALLVISAQKSRRGIMPVCVHSGLDRRQRSEVRNRLRRWHGASSGWRSWAPDVACDEALTLADRVNLAARHPWRLIARLRLRRLSFL